MWGKEKKDAIPDPTPPKDGGKGPLPSYTTATASSSAAFQTRFASLTMHMEDRLRFLSFPDQIVDICHQTIRTVWKKGIKEQREYAGSQEFKLKGYPFRGMGEEAMDARRLICALLETLHSQGWVLTLSTDISKKTTDKDALLFRHQVPTPAPCEWCCIAFCDYDRLRFIDVPAEIRNALTPRLDAGWIQKQGEYKSGVYEFKLKGMPWCAEGTESMKVRGFLLVLLEVLESEGWTVYASVDQSNSGENYSETDTWHICRPKGWMRGAPVYHN